MHIQPNPQPALEVSMDPEMEILDSQAEIRVPHEVTKTRRDGQTYTEVKDARTSVTIRDHGCLLQLFFAGNDLSGEAALNEVRILPGVDAFEPWLFAPRLPIYLSYARAAMAGHGGRIDAALHALRAAGKPRRGHSDEFYRQVASIYKALIAEGEPHPVKALAKMEPVDISTASRWVTEAKRRGLIKKEED
jgi:hypothetical protein